MKKFLCLFFTLILVAVFCAGCGGLSVPNNPGQSDSEPPAVPEEPVFQPYSPVYAESLPMISINTLDGSEITGDKFNSEYKDSTVSLDNCDAEYAFTDVTAEVKVRGNYTANYPKKPYRIKFTKKRGFLGMNGGAECKSWVLLADYKDPSMLRNATANHLGQLMIKDDGYYSTDFRPVEVTVNGKYRGVYLLVEQQQVNINRVNVTEPDEDYVGHNIGYLLEFDWYYTESPAMESFKLDYYAPKLTTRSGSSVSVSQSGYTIKSDVYSNDQRDYIRKYMTNLYEIVYRAVYEREFMRFDDSYNITESDFKSAQETVSAVIDVRSLVNMYIFSELCADRDVASSSFYMSTDLAEGKNDKLTFHAPWDWDSALGIMKDPDVDEPLACEKNWRDQVNPWLVVLINEKWFRTMIAERWAELTEMNVRDSLQTLIKTYTELYAENYAENFKIWPACIGSKVDNKVKDELLDFKTQADASRQLSEWLAGRFEFLDEFFAGDLKVNT